MIGGTAANFGKLIADETEKRGKVIGRHTSGWSEQDNISQCPLRDYVAPCASRVRNAAIQSFHWSDPGSGGLAFALRRFIPGGRRHCCQRHPIADGKLPIDAMHMELDGAGGKIEPVSDFFVRPPLANQLHDLTFVLSQCRRQRCVN